MTIVTYEIEIEGEKELEVENTLILTEIKITKNWDDAENQDGLRLSAEDYVRYIKLMAGTEEVLGYAAEITDNENGSYTIQ